MTVQGVAVPTDVLTAPSPSDLYPIAAVRSVAIRSDDFYRYQDHLTAAGIHRACVVTTESLGANPDGWAAAMAELLDNVVPSYWIVGNECDAGYLPVPSSASDRMDPPVYAVFWDAVVPQIRARQPGVPVATFGFVSGSVDVLRDYERFCREADLVNIHPWSKNADEARDLVWACRRVLGEASRILIGEWNRPAAEIPAYVHMLKRQAAVDAAFFFSWHTFDVPGLTDHLGQKTERYHAFIKALNEPPPEVIVTNIDMRANGSDIKDRLGPALGEEIDLGQGVRLKAFNNAVLLEVGSAGVYCLPESTVIGSFLPN